MVPILLLVGISFAVYANALFNGFVLDDESQLLRNPWIQDWRSIPDMFSKNVWSFLRGGSSNYYRPLMHVIYLVTWHLFGLNAWAFHLVNVLFHAANTALVFLLATRLVGFDQDNGGGIDTRLRAMALSAPFIAALLFATHPVHTEAVAWIASVPELSFTFFCLTCLYLYVAPARGSGQPGTVAIAAESIGRGARRGIRASANSTSGTQPGDPAQSTRNRAVTWGVLFFLGLLCKETALTLPAVCVAYDAAIRKNERWIPDRLTRYVPFLLAAVVYLVLRLRLPARLPGPGNPTTVGVEWWVANVFSLFKDYLHTLIRPNRLHFWHPFRPVDSLATVEGVVSAAVAIGFLAAAAVAWKRHRLSFFCLVLVALPLAPAFYISALPGKPFAERYLYLPSVGFVLLAAMGLRMMLRTQRLRVAAVLALIATSLAYGAGTIARNRVWKNFTTLYADTMSKAPDAPVPCDDLANAMFSEGRVDEAIEQFERQIRADPSNSSCQSALGSALLMKGRLDEAIEHLRISLSLNSQLTASYNDLGIALKKKGDVAAAIEHYRKALAIDPEFADARLSLANALVDTGKLSEAMEEYRAVVKLRPHNVYYRNVLGIECAKQGLLDEAIEQFQEAIRLDPQEPASRSNLERAQRLKEASGEPPIPR